MENHRLIKELEEIINENEYLYRSGKPVISDQKFDEYVEELRRLDAKNPVLKRFLGEIIGGKTIKFPYKMGSLNKIKSERELGNWLNKMSNDKNSNFVITPKYDGISVGLEERVVTRGGYADGNIDITDRYYRTMLNYVHHPTTPCRGELIISNNNFKTMSSKYSSPRSAVMGLMSGDFPDLGWLKMVELKPFERFGFSGNKINEYETLRNRVVVGELVMKVLKGREIKHKALVKLHEEWSSEYPIDGLVIELSNKSTISEPRYDTKGNPTFSIAYKNNFEKEEVTTVLGIERKADKSGVLNPVAIVEPIKLRGDTVGRINLDNERFIKYYGIGVGSTVSAVKSGGVIPRVTRVDGVKVLNNKEFIKVVNSGMMASEFISENDLVNNYNIPEELSKGHWSWDANNVKLRLAKIDDSVMIKSIYHFFKTMKILSVGMSAIESMWNIGFKSVEDIINGDLEQLTLYDGWGHKKVDNMKKAIREKLSNTNPARLMSASNCFPGLAESKLNLILEGLEDNKLLDIEGVGQHTAEIYEEGLSDWYKFYDSIKSYVNYSNNSEGLYVDKVFCFTGFRDNNLVKFIEDNGGKYKDSLSKEVTDLIFDGKSNAKAKLEKAEKYGINVIERLEFLEQKTETPDFKTLL